MNFDNDKQARGMPVLPHRSPPNITEVQKSGMIRFIPFAIFIVFGFTMVSFQRIAYVDQRMLDENSAVRLSTTRLYGGNELTVINKIPVEQEVDAKAVANTVLESADNVIVTPTKQSQQELPKEKSFLDAARKTGTDKVKGLAYLPDCLKDDSTCTRPSCEREKCRPWGHFYHTMYQSRFGKYTLPDTEPFQLLEIGFVSYTTILCVCTIISLCAPYFDLPLRLTTRFLLLRNILQNYGWGYDAFKDFFSEAKGSEFHSMEISCIEPGPREEGKWPWGNFAKDNKHYESLLEQQLLHCGDASNVTWLNEVWMDKMHRPDAPPLKIVVEDGSHLAKHMVHTFFFWFPRIEPGGMLIVEDIQPIQEANLFRTQFLPQIMADLHFCGDPKQKKDHACFPNIYPLLQSIHCEMHICVFERNQEPAIPNLPLDKSIPPPNALDMSKCYSFANAFGSGLDVG
jgi:hypothetical protein